MQAQVLRCKATVTGILLSAGETRAESPERMPATDFFDNLVDGWKTTRAVRDFRYLRSLDDSITLVSDEGLKQMICNVLDNALEVSPEQVTLDVLCKDDDLVIRVQDRGPGFSAAMLAQFGRPYQSSKGRAGSGLGLFLSLNVARALGGNIFPQNREDGGAVVTMVLPLAALTLEEEAVDD
jgi:two-component system sensor histidine kinase RegB